MFVTTITNGANLGTTTPLLNQSITKTTLQTGTTGVIINVKLVNGPETPNQSQAVEVWYVILPYSLTADATLPPTVNPLAKLLRVQQPQQGNGTKIEASLSQDPNQQFTLIPNNGGYLYTWFNSPPMSPGGGAAGTITITSVELP